MTTTKDAARLLKQEKWAERKAEDRLLRKEPRGVATTIAEPRLKNPCTCGHTRKHHKKSGRCRGKILDGRQVETRRIAGAFGVPARTVSVPASCDCNAGVRR